MTRVDKLWQAEGLAARYVDSVRGAIPLADEQIAVMLLYRTRFLGHKFVSCGGPE